MPRFTRSRAPGGVAVGSTGSQVVTASSGVALAICLAWRLAVIHTPPAARPGAASAPVVGAPHDIVGDRPRARDVLLSGGSRPEGVRTLPLAVAWGVAGPADVRRAGVVVDGDDGRRTGAVIVFVGMDTDGSGGGGEARVAGVGRWFARRHLVIGEQRRQDLEHRGVLAAQGRIEQLAHPVCLRRRLVRLRFSSTCTPGRRCSTMTSSVAITSTKNASLRSATSSQHGLYAPGSMAVPKASTAAAAVGWPASARGSSPRDRLAASGPSRSGRFVSPATTPTSLVANQVPPPTSSRPPRMAGPPTPSSRVIGIAGRARRSSRLAATISGIPGTTPLITIKRHIGGSLGAGGATGGCSLPSPRPAPLPPPPSTQCSRKRTSPTTQ